MRKEKKKYLDLNPSKIHQKKIPRCTFQEAIVISEFLMKKTERGWCEPYIIINGLNIWADIGWQRLTGASEAYGLTSGGYNSEEITITPLGIHSVTASSGILMQGAFQKAILNTEIHRRFFLKYEGKKFPNIEEAKAELHAMNYPFSESNAEKVINLILENAIFSGILADKDAIVTINHAGIKMIDDLCEETDATPCNPLKKEPDATIKLKTRENNRIYVSCPQEFQLTEIIKNIMELGGFKIILADYSTIKEGKIIDEIKGIMGQCDYALICDDGKENSFNRKLQILSEVIFGKILFGNDKTILLRPNDQRVPEMFDSISQCSYDDNITESILKIMEKINKLKRR